MLNKVAQRKHITHTRFLYLKYFSYLIVVLHVLFSHLHSEIIITFSCVLRNINNHLFMCSTKHYRQRPLLVSPGWNLFIDANIHIFLGERIRNLREVQTPIS
jgi:hypothetical protein